MRVGKIRTFHQCSRRLEWKIGPALALVRSPHSLPQRHLTRVEGDWWANLRDPPGFWCTVVQQLNFRWSLFSSDPRNHLLARQQPRQTPPRWSRRERTSTIDSFSNPHRAILDPNDSNDAPCRTLLTCFQRPQQEGSRPRQAHPLQQLLAMHPQGQGHQALHHPQHGRVCCYPFVSLAPPTPTLANLQQVTSRMPPSLRSTPYPRCT